MISIKAPQSHYQTPIARFGIRTAAVLLLASGAGLLIPGVQNVLDARASSGWPTVPGKVRESSVEESQTPGSRKTYSAHVLYEYVVNNQAYTADDISFSDVGLADRGPIDDVVARYPVGKAVTVYHKPADPTRVLLEPGASTGVYLMSLLPPFMIVLGVVVWRSAKKPTAAADPAGTSTAP